MLYILKVLTLCDIIPYLFFNIFPQVFILKKFQIHSKVEGFILHPYTLHLTWVLSEMEPAGRSPGRSGGRGLGGGS